MCLFSCVSKVDRQASRRLESRRAGYFPLRNTHFFFPHPILASFSVSSRNSNVYCTDGRKRGRKGGGGWGVLDSMLGRGGGDGNVRPGWRFPWARCATPRGGDGWRDVGCSRLPFSLPLRLLLLAVCFAGFDVPRSLARKEGRACSPPSLRVEERVRQGEIASRGFCRRFPAVAEYRRGRDFTPYRTMRCRILAAFRWRLRRIKAGAIRTVLS